VKRILQNLEGGRGRGLKIFRRRNAGEEKKKLVPGKGRKEERTGAWRCKKRGGGASISGLQREGGEKKGIKKRKGEKKGRNYRPPEGRKETQQDQP